LLKRYLCSSSRFKCLVPQVAILFGGNDHMFELNEIRNVATIGYDTGAIYGGRDLSSRVSAFTTVCLTGYNLCWKSPMSHGATTAYQGTTIRFNLFHHLDNPSICNPETSCIRQAIYSEYTTHTISRTPVLFE
jgi:hypothetical protein